MSNDYLTLNTFWNRTVFPDLLGPVIKSVFPLFFESSEFSSIER